MTKKWGKGNLPDAVDDTNLIVSAIVANAFPERTDLLCPETKRFTDGSIRCTALVRVQTSVNAEMSKKWADGYEAGKAEAQNCYNFTKKAYAIAMMDLITSDPDEALKQLQYDMEQ